MSHANRYVIGRAMLAALAATAFSACDDGARERERVECVSNPDCNAAGQICDEESHTCVDAPDATPGTDIGAPDATPQPRPDRGLDMAPDPDAGPDMALDPDAGPDMAPDTTPDPDAGPDMAPEPDAGPDMMPDPDMAPDAGCVPAGEEQCNEIDDDCDGRIDEGLPRRCSPFVLTGGRVTWAAGTSRSADERWVLEGRGAALDGRPVSGGDGAAQYQLTGSLKVVGGLQMEGQ